MGTFVEELDGFLQGAPGIEPATLKLAPGAKVGAMVALPTGWPVKRIFADAWFHLFNFSLC